MTSQSEEPTVSKQDSTLSFIKVKVDDVPYASSQLEPRNVLPLTTTTRLAGFGDCSALSVTNISDTFETTLKPTSGGITTCPPHHWMVTNPRSKFGRGSEGDLVERTDQTCKKCGEYRLNEVVVPPERATAPGLELGGS